MSDELDEIRRRSEAMANSQRFMFGHEPEPCSETGCELAATKVVRYRRVRTPDETAGRVPYCDEHAGRAIAIFAPTWNVVAWVESLTAPSG